MASAMKASGASLWVQPDGPGTRPYYLGCHQMGDITVPKGDVTPMYCPDEKAVGKYKVTGSTRGVPGLPSTAITTDIAATADWLETVSNRGCPVPLYLLLTDCGRRDVFTNYKRIFALRRSTITQEGLTQISSLNGDDNRSQQAFQFAAEEFIRVWSIAGAKQVTAETEAINDVTFCNDLECGECGAPTDVCQTGYAVTDFLTGSPTNTADVLKTTDGGTTWAATTADPFGMGESIGAVVCFKMTNAVTRVLVARLTTDGAAPAEVAYSDDGGATWTSVNVGSVNGQHVMGPNGLFALDRYNIWLVTDGGYVYYSEDGGETWAAQSAAGIAAEDLYAVHFKDSLHGWVGGANNTLGSTADGGLTWAVEAGPAARAADTAQALAVTGDLVAYVGYSSGHLYRTPDAGGSWTLLSFTGSGAGEINDVKFINELVGFMVHDTAAPAGTIFRTWDGGYTWEAVSTPTNVGLNALHVCGPNVVYAVGEPSTYGIIIKAS